LLNFATIIIQAEHHPGMIKFFAVRTKYAAPD
jgi:hypothetical protein